MSDLSNDEWAVIRQSADMAIRYIGGQIASVGAGLSSTGVQTLAAMQALAMRADTEITAANRAAILAEAAPPTTTAAFPAEAPDMGMVEGQPVPDVALAA